MAIVIDHACDRINHNVPLQPAVVPNAGPDRELAQGLISIKISRGYKDVGVGGGVRNNSL